MTNAAREQPALEPSDHNGFKGLMAAPVRGFRPLGTARQLFRIKAMVQGPTIVKLAPGECLALLEQAKVGRIALSVRALPVIQPVRFVLAAGQVLFRAAPGSELSRAAPNAVVAFQADYADEDSATAWHVMAHGCCQAVTSPTRTDELRALPLAAWGAIPHQDIFMQIALTGIKGERVSW